MQRLSKRFYLSAPIVSAVSLIPVGLYELANTAGTQSGEPTPAASLLLFAAVLGLIYAGVLGFVFLYKIWEAIQDGHARTTPAKAVGFLFIPFFNIYWVFQAMWGFAEDCNAYIERKRINVHDLPTGLFLAWPILLLCSGLPLVGFAYAAVFAVVISKTCDVINGFEMAVSSDAHMLSLYFLSGEFANDSMEIPTAGVTLGRDPAKANLVFHSARVSALHARLRPNGQGQVWVEDVDSLNGTYYRQGRVNGENGSWVRLKGQILMSAGMCLRLAEDAGEFEIRKQ